MTEKIQIELLSLKPEELAKLPRGLWAIPVYMDWEKVKEGLWPPPSPHQKFKVLIELVP